ncbi:MAG: hypothetical protein IKK26_01755 [Clostridia bacterium]|nr:hypothetical protein [Clostridia bacterium]MBR6651467.1 hypothetical protein [Clostridia bacterium]
MKKIIVVLLLIASVLSLSSCSVTNEFLARLGFDTHDYEGEAVVETYDNESEQTEKIREMVRTLSINSPHIPTFDGSKDAVSKCRDSLLNYMLNTQYSKYTGNLDLLDKAIEQYPYLKVATVIPAEDFEDEAYRYFGGKQKVQNQSGNLFTYLDKVSAYTTVTTPVESKINIECISLEETLNTFRFKFRCSLGEETSDDYFALIIKRADGSCYFKYVEKIAQ